MNTGRHLSWQAGPVESPPIVYLLLSGTESGRTCFNNRVLQQLVKHMLRAVASSLSPELRPFSLVLFCGIWCMLNIWFTFSLNLLKCACKTYCYSICHRTWGSPSEWLYFILSTKTKNLYAWKLTIKAIISQYENFLLHIITRILWQFT